MQKGYSICCVSLLQLGLDLEARLKKFESDVRAEGQQREKKLRADFQADLEKQKQEQEEIRQVQLKLHSVSYSGSLMQ